MARNAVTDTVLLSIKRIGNSDFENDGSFDGGTETFHAGVAPLIDPDVVPLFHQKIVASTPTEMSAGEKTAVDNNNALFAAHRLVSATSTVNPGNQIIGCDVSGGGITVTLPAIDADTPVIVVSDEEGSCTITKKIVVDTTGADTINKDTSVEIMAAFNSLTFVNDGVSNWFLR